MEFREWFFFYFKRRRLIRWPATICLRREILIGFVGCVLLHEIWKMMHKMHWQQFDVGNLRKANTHYTHTHTNSNLLTINENSTANTRKQQSANSNPMLCVSLDQVPSRPDPTAGKFTTFYRIVVCVSREAKKIKQKRNISAESTLNHKRKSHRIVTAVIHHDAVTFSWVYTQLTQPKNERRTKSKTIQ